MKELGLTSPNLVTASVDQYSTNCTLLDRHDTRMSTSRIIREGEPSVEILATAHI